MTVAGGPDTGWVASVVTASLFPTDAELDGTTVGARDMLLGLGSRLDGALSEWEGPLEELLAGSTVLAVD